MQIIVICVVISFAQCTIITRARLLNHIQINTKKDAQTNPVKDAQINSSGYTQTNPLEDAETNPSESTQNQTNNLEVVPTTPSDGHQITSLKDGETVLPGSVLRSTKISKRKRETLTFFNATDKKMHQSYSAKQATAILKGEGTSRMKRSVVKKDNAHHINQQNGSSTLEVEDPQTKVESQTVRLWDKQTATSTPTTSTKTTQAQHSENKANCTTSRWGIRRIISDFVEAGRGIRRKISNFIGARRGIRQKISDFINSIDKTISCTRFVAGSILNLIVVAFKMLMVFHH